MSQPSCSAEPRSFAGSAAGLGWKRGVCWRICGGGLGGGRDLWGVKSEAAFVQELLKGRARDKSGAAEFDRGDPASVAEFETVTARVDGVGDALRAPPEKVCDFSKGEKQWLHGVLL